MAFSCANMRSVASPSFRNALSVISSSSRAGASPEDPSALITTPGNAGLANWIGDTLTETRILSGHSDAAAHAARITHSPSGPIRPDSSATGMKSDGGMGPRTG